MSDDLIEQQEVGKDNISDIIIRPLTGQTVVISLEEWNEFQLLKSRAKESQQSSMTDIHVKKEEDKTTDKP